jgi:hypothetical protein
MTAGVVVSNHRVSDHTADAVMSPNTEMTHRGRPLMQRRPRASVTTADTATTVSVMTGGAQVLEEDVDA